MTRPLIYTGLLILSLAVLSSVLYLDSYLYRGVDLGAHDELSPQLPGNGMGINTFLDREADLKDIRRTLETVKAAGFTWVRQQFPWEDIEPLPGVYERSDGRGGKVSTWTKYDFIVSEADRLGLNLLIRLDRPPAWARQRGLATSKPDSTGPPDDFATFANFARTIAERYSGRPRYYQVWNEPNLHNEWNDQPIDPAGYVRLLAAAYAAIKQADPQATVVMAGLAPTDQIGTENLNDLMFLEEAYKAGLSRYFDVMAVMVYGLGYPPQDRRTDLFRANFSRPALVRYIMEHYGDSHKPVIAAELAWISLPEDWNGRPSIWGQSVNENLQARYLVEGYRRARSEWPWMSTMFVWALKWPTAGPDDPLDPTPYFSIMYPNFQPRPAYHALAAYASTAELSIGRHRYIGSSLTFTTYANRVDLIIDDSAPPTSVTWSIDGQKAGSSDLKPGRTVVISGLTDTPHLVVLTFPGPTSFEIDLIRLHPLPYGTASAVAASFITSALAIFWLIGSLSEFGKRLRLLLVLLLAAISHPRSSVRRAVAWADGVLQDRYHRYAILAVTALLASVATLGGPNWLLLAVLISFGALSALWPGMGLAGLLATLGFVFRPVETAAGQFASTELLAWAWLAGTWGRLAMEWRGCRPAVHGAGIWATVIAPGAFFATATFSLLVPPPYWLKYALREYRTVILEPMLVYATMLALGKRLGDLRWPLAGLSAGAAAVGLIGIVQYFTGADLVIAEGIARITSVYKHPNNLGLYLDRVLPYSLVLAISVDRRWRWSMFISTAISLVALILTFSRGAWVATIAAIVVAALAQRRSKAALAGALISAALFATLAVSQVARLGELLQWGSGSTSLRLLLWQSAISMIRDHPFTGLGLDQFLYHYNPQYVLPGAWEERFTSHAHNLILDLWTRLGIIGLGTGIGLVVMALRESVGALKHATGPDRWLLVGVVASSAAMLVHGMVDNAFFGIDLAYIFWVSYGTAMEAAGRVNIINSAPISAASRTLEVRPS